MRWPSSAFPAGAPFGVFLMRQFMRDVPDELWYDTSTGDAISGPGGTSIEGRPLTGQLISNVDNSWFGAGLVITRQAFPELARRASALLDAMDYGIFFDRGDQATRIDTGQMYGGWIVDQGPAGFHFGLLNSETRIGAYMGTGDMPGDMPGDVWWRTWRTLPAEFDWQGQPPVGEPVTYADPRSGRSFTVVEGHHRYLVLDQGMIMTALDNALRDRAMQRRFAADPVGQAARPYLGIERFSVS